MIYGVGVILILFLVAMIDVVKEEVKMQDKRQYIIPKEFWDDYNRIMFYIDRMKINEIDRTQDMVTDLIVKYHNCMEYNAFTDKIGLMITKLEDKKRVFLLNTQLN
jgi:bifunctional DNA-binding transcriptional regulator/antitoxin component of YhaV-PrlF toxin-antitoxin module